MPSARARRQSRLQREHSSKLLLLWSGVLLPGCRSRPGGHTQVGLLRHAGKMPECQAHCGQFLQTKPRRRMPLPESELLRVQGGRAGRELGLSGAERHLPGQQAAAELGLRPGADLSVFGRVVLLQLEQLELPRRLSARRAASGGCALARIRSRLGLERDRSARSPGALTLRALRSFRLRFRTLRWLQTVPASTRTSDTSREDVTRTETIRK